MTERQRSTFGQDPESPFARCTAIRVGHRISVGQVGPEWPDGHIDPDPEAQTRRCLEIIAGALRELGSGLDDIVRTYLWLRHPGDIAAASRAHASLLGHVRPAISRLVVPGFLDPRWSVQLEADAVVGGQRQHIAVDTYPDYELSERRAGGSRAIKVDNRVLVSATAPIWPDGPDGFSDPAPDAQFNRCADIVDQTLAAAGTDVAHVVRTHLWLKQPKDGPPTTRTHFAHFKDVLPASTQVCVQNFARPNWRVELDAEADLTPDRRNLFHFLRADRPGNMGMSRGVRVGNRVLISCCAPRWPDRTGQSPIGAGPTNPDPGAEAQRCLEVIVGALHEADADVEHLTRVRMYLRHPADAAIMARVSHDTFGTHKPALSVFPILGYMNPAWRVEIEAEAII